MTHTEKGSSDEVLKQLREVAAMVMHAAEAETLDKILQNIANIARDLIGARYAALGVPDQKGGLRTFKVSGMNRTEMDAIAHPPVGIGLLGSILRDAEPVRINRMSEHPESVGFPAGHPHMDSLMGVPIKLGEQVFGIFYLTDRVDGKPFTDDDQWLLEIMSGYAALVIADKHLQDQRQQIALMREREQIGMTLHDGVIQSIYALGMRLDLANRQGNIRREDVTATLDGLNQVIEDIRSAIYRLNENDEDKLSLRRRMNNILENLYIPSEIDVELNLPNHPLPLSDDTMTALEMMLNECLSNVVRHASATVIVVSFKDHGSRIEITVQDNGVGFEPTMLRGSQGLGLRNLERRARMHGGSLDIESAPGEGTRIEILMPLD
jgi:nitrate/nitrite-specific signal transduction histidine kinase